MGVTGILTRLKPILHHIDLLPSSSSSLHENDAGNTKKSNNDNELHDGSNRETTCSSTTTRKRSRTSFETTSTKLDADIYDDDTSDKKELTSTKKEHTHKKRKKRKMRIGIDIHTWIAKACHGRGATLLDERHLTNHGRAEILQAREGQNKKRSSRISSGTSCGGNNNNHNERNRQQEEEKRGTELMETFIAESAISVVRKMKTLTSVVVDGEILAVFDGATPPIKKACCQSRKKQRDVATAQRDKISESGHGNANMDINDQRPTSKTDSNQRSATFIEMKNKNKEIIDLINQDEALQSNRAKLQAAKRAGAQNSKIYASVISAVMKLLRDEKIPFLVAPYEADGQLAFLANSGLIDLVVTEDSDFIGLGVETVLYKYCDVLEEDEFGERRKLRCTGDLYRKMDLGTTCPPFSLVDFSDVMLSILMVAAGCDYCDSLRGIGLITARNIIEMTFNEYYTGYTCEPILQRIIKSLLEKSTAKLSNEEKETYKAAFVAALAMFRHPVVFDPIRSQCVFRGPLDNALIDYPPYHDIVTNKTILESIVGVPYTKELSIHIVEGWINPKTETLWNAENETPLRAVSAWRKCMKKSEQIQEIVLVDDNVGNTINKNNNDSENDTTVETREISSLHQRSRFSTSQSSQSTSLSKPSTQASNQSSNVSVDVLSPNLLSMPLHPNLLSKESTQTSNQSEIISVLSPNMVPFSVLPNLSSKNSTQTSHQNSNASGDGLSPNLLPSPVPPNVLDKSPTQKGNVVSTTGFSALSSFSKVSQNFLSESLS